MNIIKQFERFSNAQYNIILDLMIWITQTYSKVINEQQVQYVCLAQTWKYFNCLKVEISKMIKSTEYCRQRDQ